MGRNVEENMKKHVENIGVEFAGGSANLPRHLFLSFINSGLRSQRLEALRVQHDPHSVTHGSLGQRLRNVRGIIQRVRKLRRWGPCVVQYFIFAHMKRWREQLIGDLEGWYEERRD